MSQDQLIDHLFRHQYGKMVSILTRLFGLPHLTLIEDVVQDTFMKATLSWRNEIPANPEAWLMTAAKNRTIDLFRKLKSDQNREQKFVSGPSTIAINEVFMDDEIEDSQLRMIFTACHPILKAKEQIAFALKTISGFSTGEIAAALLTKEDSIKKSLSRARKNIIKNKIEFEIPIGDELKSRLHRVHDVIYVIFNEGFHSIKNSTLIRKELCAEAMRLCKLILDRPSVATGTSHALFGLMCFHAARLESKLNDHGDMVSFRHQDRKKWHFPLIVLGSQHMETALRDPLIGSYHIEAAIANEHLMSPSFEKTNWGRILMWYEKLYLAQPSELVKLNIAIVYLQLGKINETQKVLGSIDKNKLGQRYYLMLCTEADIFVQSNKINLALQKLTEAMDLVQNQKEKDFIANKIKSIAT